MSEITYDDKVDLQVATNIANINKVTASDMNEIKNVVNGNADEVGDITSLTTTDKTNVVNAVNELNAPEKWVSVGATAPTDGRRVWFEYSRNILPENLYMATRTLNGITYTNNGNGIISFSGTATANTSIQIIPDSKMSFKAGQPYYLYSSVPYNSTTFNLSIALTENGATRYLLANGTYTPTYNSTQARLSLYIPNGTTISATNVKLMLIEGNTAPSEYEPYVAEHSIKIDNSTLIGQDNLVSVGINQPGDGKRVWFAKGKNLFDIDNAYHGTINGSGVVGPNEGFRTTQNIPTQPGKTYYFSTTQKSGTTGNQIYIAYYNSSGTFVSRTSYNLLKSAFTTPANCYYMRAGVRSENQENIMLNEGTIELPYEPYVEPSINVDGEELNFDNYSTNEQIIGKWIDGKNIYRKTYQVTNISSSNADLVDVSGLNIETVVKLYGFIRSQVNMCMPMPLTDSSTNYNVIFLSVNKIRGRVEFGTGGSLKDCYITIEYTKN